MWREFLKSFQFGKGICPNIITYTRPISEIIRCGIEPTITFPVGSYSIKCNWSRVVDWHCTLNKWPMGSPCWECFSLIEHGNNSLKIPVQGGNRILSSSINHTNTYIQHVHKSPLKILQIKNWKRFYLYDIKIIFATQANDNS